MVTRCRCRSFTNLYCFWYSLLQMNSKKKLYTNINKAVPFHVKLGEWPANERDFQVRVTAVFSSHQYARAHVKRCPIHASPLHQTNIGEFVALCVCSQVTLSDAESFLSFNTLIAVSFSYSKKEVI